MFQYFLSIFVFIPSRNKQLRIQVIALIFLYRFVFYILILLYSTHSIFLHSFSYSVYKIQSVAQQVTLKFTVLSPTPFHIWLLQARFQNRLSDDTVAEAEHLLNDIDYVNSVAQINSTLSLMEFVPSFTKEKRHKKCLLKSRAFIKGLISSAHKAVSYYIIY